MIVSKTNYIANIFSTNIYCKLYKYKLQLETAQMRNEMQIFVVDAVGRFWKFNKCNCLMRIIPYTMIPDFLYDNYGVLKVFLIGFRLTFSAKTSNQIPKRTTAATTAAIVVVVVYCTALHIGS